MLTSAGQRSRTHHARLSDPHACWTCRAGVLLPLTPRSSPVPGHSPGLAGGGSIGLEQQLNVRTSIHRPHDMLARRLTAFNQPGRCTVGSAGPLYLRP